MSQLNHVFICGAHSTGKTTLLDRLREHPVPESLNFMFQEEIARKIVNQGDYSQEKLRHATVLLDLNRKILKRLHDVISTEDCKIYDSSNETSVMLWDRGVVDPLTYLAEYIGDKAKDETEDLEYVKNLLTRARDRKRSLFFVIKPNSDFLCDDGVRYQSDGFKSLESFHNTMMSLMNKYGLNFVEMTQTDLDERVRYVIDVLVKKWGI